MISLQEAMAQMNIAQPVIPEKRSRSERAELLGQLYTFYQKDYKKQTWKTYVTWLKENKKKHSKDMMEVFKKTKSYYPIIKEKSFFSYWIGHVPTRDLYYLLSIAKDKDNRRESFNKWLFFNLKSTE